MSTFLFKCYVTTPASPLPQFQGVYAESAAAAKQLIREAAQEQQVKIVKLKVVKFG